MEYELRPITEAGRRFVALAEEHAADFVSRAGRHDRENSFVLENVAAMQESGFMAACIPQEFGGLGLESAHDFALGFNRLARGDASTAISTTMHVAISWSLNRLREGLIAGRAEQQAAPLEMLLRHIGAAQVVLCDPVSESGTDVLHPLTEATQTKGGWNVNGRKVFASLSPAANMILITLRVPDENGGFRLAMTILPRDRAGVELKDNWDALGMRGSGSHDLVLKNCFIPEEESMSLGPWGSWNEPFFDLSMFSMHGLIAAFLGIAEAAREAILEQVKTQRKAPSGRTLAERYPIQHAVAENEIDLAAARALLEYMALTTDRFYAANPIGKASMDDLHRLNKELQCAKSFVMRKSMEIADRALTLSGGAGYLNSNALSRHYRDVRAGPFMQPFSPNEAFEYIGKVTLGLNPELNM